MHARASLLIKLLVAFAAPFGVEDTLSTTFKMYSQFSETSVSSVARATALSISLLTAARNMVITVDGIGHRMTERVCVSVIVRLQQAEVNSLASVHKLPWMKLGFHESPNVIKARVQRFISFQW